jgi:hypothetical protein
LRSVVITTEESLCPSGENRQCFALRAEVARQSPEFSIAYGEVSIFYHDLSICGGSSAYDFTDSDEASGDCDGTHIESLLFSESELAQRN